ncbi:MAG: methionyl-tRNA formyltransferase [Candidatus Saccharimonadales bacterium]
MKNSLKKIVFFGTEDFSLVALNGLVEHGFNVVAVVTKPDSKKGRGQKITISSVKKYAIDNNIAVWQPTKVADINPDIEKLGRDATGVLSSFGKIIPSSTIDLFNPGIINVHPSLLPRYRGASPIESAIKNSDKQTGVTIMQLAAGMDSGPIYAQVTHGLSGKETRPELYQTLSQVGTSLLIDILPDIIDGSLQPQDQDNNQATYCTLIKKEDGHLNPGNITAKQAESLVRAYTGYPKAKLELSGHLVIVLKSHVSNAKESALDIECQDRKFLSIDELIAPSGRKMSGKDFLNGYTA